MVFALGMINALENNSKRDKKIPPIQYGRISLFKLIPEDKTGINSDLFAIFEVKNITEIKTNKGNNNAMICGMNPI